MLSAVPKVLHRAEVPLQPPSPTGENSNKRKRVTAPYQTKRRKLEAEQDDLNKYLNMAKEQNENLEKQLINKTALCNRMLEMIRARNNSGPPLSFALAQDAIALSQKIEANLQIYADQGITNVQCPSRLLEILNQLHTRFQSRNIVIVSKLN